MKLRINEKEFPLLSARATTENMKNFRRDVISLTIEATYAEAATEFTDGSTFTVVDDSVTPAEEFEYTDHTMAGPITDHRDGTVTVKMGKANTAEQDALDAQQAAEAQAAKVSQSLVTLAGKPIQESEVSSLRASFENAANKLSDDDAKIAPSLTTAWDMGQQVSTGQRRYYAPDGNLYKALQDHTTSISTFPDTATDYWVKL